MNLIYTPYIIGVNLVTNELELQVKLVILLHSTLFKTYSISATIPRRTVAHYTIYGSTVAPTCTFFNASSSLRIASISAALSSVFVVEITSSKPNTESLSSA